MDNSFDQLSSDTQPKRDLFASLLQLFAWLVALFAVTEEEKINAGIYLGRVRDSE